MEISTLGFVGVGAMGSRMIRHISKKAGKTLVYDVDAGHAKAVAESVSGVVVSGLEGFANADVVILSLPTSTIIDEVVRGSANGTGLLDVLSSGALIIDMSSAVPTNTVENSTRAKKKGITFVDAPVSGGVGGAEAGTLAIMVGGSDEEFQRVEPILQTMGKTIVHTGGVGSGHAVKALNNLLTATTLVATAEAFAVGQKFGLDPEVMLKVFDSSSASSFQTKVVWPHVLSGKFDYGFTIKLMEKDVRTAMSLISALGANVNLSKLSAQIWADGLQHAGANDDMTKLVNQIDDRVNGRA